MNLIFEDEIDQILNIRILRLAAKLSLIFQRETLRPAGVKVQEWRVLVSLAQFGELHLRALARHASQDPAHTSRIVGSMIKAGWIKSRSDKKDQRRIIYTLTKKGERIVEKIWPEAKRFAADLAALFNKKEFAQFKSMLDTANAFCDSRVQGEDHE